MAFFHFLFLLIRFRSGHFPPAFNLVLDEVKLGSDGWDG